jgi:predicted CXXCH cytochrome family protein
MFRFAFVLVAAFALAWAVWAAESEQAGRIVRPTDGSAFATGPIEAAATAPGGRMELDGKPVEAETPFPDVLRATLDAEPGEHTLALIWEGGRAEARFWIGDGPPETYTAFRIHPPPAGADCALCHGLSRRGRFRFQGDCFACHTDAQFTAKHPHAKHVLEECGRCHNAHGSSAASHLSMPREDACRQCHSL